MADPKKLVAAILKGDYEGHEAQIVQAVRQRVQDGKIRFGWRIDFEGLEITEENLTIGEAVQIEQTLTKSPVNDESEGPISIHFVVPAGSATNIAAIVTACLMSRNGLDAEAANTTVNGYSLKALLNLVTDYTVTDPPKDSGAPEQL